jgi:hypothetical protein
LPTASASRIRLCASAALLAVLALSGCAERDLWPVERLDPKTAVNVTIMVDPWVYGHDVPMLAANARDYLNVGVVETNRAGTRAYWLGVVAWSTIDRSALPVPVAPVRPGTVKLRWPEETLELKPAAAGRQAIGSSGTIFAGPQPVQEDAWYELNAAQLSRLAKSPPATVSLVLDDGAVIVHQPWHVDQRAMDQFLEATGFTPVGP